MSTNDADSQTNKLKRKTIEYTVEKVSRPDPSADVLQTFKANSSHHFEMSNVWTVDVFPCMIPIVMYIILIANRHYPIVTNKEYSKISTATLCMYYLSIVYGYFLINDLEVRPNSSAHARAWKNNATKMEFVNFMKHLPVPEFIATILAQFTPCETERSKNVFFIPSAAGYDHDQYFGRVFPVKFFAEIHDCLANLSGGATMLQIRQYLYTRPLYTIGNDFTCLIPDLIGISLDQTTATTANYVNSKLYQVFNTLFNPVLFRDNQRRPSLAALSFESPSYENAHINAYDMMFSASGNNLDELEVVLHSVGAILKGTIPISGRLDEIISKGSGNSIFMHGYSTYPLPTWSHNEGATKPTTFEAVTDFRLVSANARAIDFCFLQRPAAAIPTTNTVVDVVYGTTEAPNVPVDLPENHVLTRHFPGSLRNNANANTNWPAHDSAILVSFDSAMNTAPPVLVLDTIGDEGLSAYLATLSGKVIESFELDGSTVEIPTYHRTIGPQNAQFADSAIPYKYVRPGSYYHPRAAGSVLPPLSRRIFPPTSQLTVSSLLHSRAMVMLPRFQRQINDTLGDVLPGMTAMPGAVSAHYCQSMIGFKCCDSSGNADAIDTVPGMTANRLLVWSPYTYNPYDSNTWPVNDLSQSRHYYLTNLRTFFGTDYNLVRVAHAYKALSVV